MATAPQIEKQSVQIPHVEAINMAQPAIPVVQSTPVTIQARLVTQAGVNAVPADFATNFGRKIYYESASPADVILNDTQPIAGSVFDPMKTGPEWVADDIGYNFSTEFSGGSFLFGGGKYLIEITLTLASSAQDKLTILQWVHIRQNGLA